MELSQTLRYQFCCRPEVTDVISGSEDEITVHHGKASTKCPKGQILSSEHGFRVTKRGVCVCGWLNGARWARFFFTITLPIGLDDHWNKIRLPQEFESWTKRLVWWRNPQSQTLIKVRTGMQLQRLRGPTLRVEAGNCGVESPATTFQ